MRVTFVCSFFSGEIRAFKYGATGFLYDAVDIFIKNYAV